MASVFINGSPDVMCRVHAEWENFAFYCLCESPSESHLQKDPVNQHKFGRQRLSFGAMKIIFNFLRITFCVQILNAIVLVIAN